MVSGKVTGELPSTLQSFLALEQFNLYKPSAYRSAVGTFDAEYLPEGGGAFSLPCFWIDRRHFYVYGWGTTAPGLFDFAAAVAPAGHVLFPVHPMEMGRYTRLLARLQARDTRAEGLRLVAASTSSARTLLVWPKGNGNKAFFVKLSMQPGIFGDRRLYRRSVAGSIGLSRVAQEEACGVSGMRYFSEPAGVVLRSLPDSGVIFRAVPVECKQGGVIAAPFFSLMGGSGTHSPLILRLREAGMGTARDIIDEVVLRRFANVWVDLVFRSGLILEAHGQDLLLALSADLDPLEWFYYRDFEGLSIDWMLRRARGLAAPKDLPHACEWFSTYETWGYPLYQLVSSKMRASLFDFCHLFLRDLEAAMLEWSAKGVLRGEPFPQGDLTALFSKHLREAIRRRFGLRENEQYDIRTRLNCFLKFLLAVRAEVTGAGSDR